MNYELTYIDITNELYQESKQIRIECFFEGMPNSNYLINDNYEKSGHHLICLGDNETVVGVGRLNIKESKGIISQMAVKSNYQKLGIGGKILNALIQKCDTLGIEIIELSARENAIHFYQKNGFKILAEKYSSKKTGIIHQKMILEKKANR